MAIDAATGGLAADGNAGALALELDRFLGEAVAVGAGRLAEC